MATNHNLDLIQCLEEFLERKLTDRSRTARLVYTSNCLKGNRNEIGLTAYNTQLLQKLIKLHLTPN